MMGGEEALIREVRLEGGRRPVDFVVKRESDLGTILRSVVTWWPLVFGYFCHADVFLEVWRGC